MIPHEEYGKAVLRAAAGDSYSDWGTSVEVSYGAGRPARIDGAFGGMVAVEIESRTAKQVRGAVLDLIFHRFPKKLLVLLPVHMSNPKILAEQCHYALSRFLKQEDFRVVIASGNGITPNLKADALLVRSALKELGFDNAA